MKKIIFILLSFSVFTAWCLVENICSAQSFTLPLPLDMGPRALGMAGAFTGIADDVSNFYWNPAGLGFTERYGISTEYGISNSNTTTLPASWGTHFTYYYPNGAITALRTGTGLSFSGIPEGKNINDIFIFSQAIPFSEIFSIGLNLKAFSPNGGETVGYGADFGALLKTQYFRLGFTAQDIVAQIGGRRSNPVYRLGAGIGPFGTVMIAGQVDLIGMGEIPEMGYVFLPRVRTGIEGWLAEGRFGMRAGYSIIPLSMIPGLGPANFSTCGLGFSIKLKYFSLDYAYTIPVEGTTADNHTVSMTFMWGKTKAEIQAEEKERLEAAERARKAEELLKLASFSETLARKKEEMEAIEREKLSRDEVIQKLKNEMEKVRADSATMAHQIDILRIELEKMKADSTALSAELDKTRSELEILRAQIKKGELVAASEKEKALALEERLKQLRQYAVVDPLLKEEIAKQIAKQVYIKETPEGLLLRFNRDFFFKGRTMERVAYRSLDVIAGALKKYPGHAVTINGYTDSIGNKKLNMEISEACARAMMEYLVSRDIPEDSVFANGYGPSNPIAPNTTKAGRAQNRRVELIIYKK